jgi:HTH-type transcriptional regulator / antitoxin HigA
MEIRPISTEEEYEAAMKRLDELFEIDKRTREEQREFDAIAALIEIYEEEHWPMDDE